MSRVFNVERMNSWLNSSVWVYSLSKVWNALSTKVKWSPIEKMWQKPTGLFLNRDRILGDTTSLSNWAGDNVTK